MLELNKLDKKNLAFTINNMMMPVELTDSADIEEIKKEITSN